MVVAAEYALLSTNDWVGGSTRSHAMGMHDSTWRNSPSIGVKGKEVVRVRRRGRVVFLGDSVTTGYGLVDRAARKAYPQLLQRRGEAAGWGVQWTVSALEGIDTSYAWRRCSRLVTAHQPDWVVVLLGLNDAHPPGDRRANSPLTFEHNLLSLADRILSLDARPILIAPHPRWRTHDGRPLDPSIMDPYAEAARNVARRWLLPCIDLHERFSAMHDLERLLPDGIHPSAAGHRVIARLVEQTLWPLLQTIGRCDGDHARPCVAAADSISTP